MKQRELGAPGLMEEYSTKKRLKKTVSVVVLMAFACVSALSGCGKEERAARTEEDVQEIREDVSSDSAGQEAQPSDENTTNILIAYFSRADNVQQDSNLDATSSASINLKGEEYTGNMEIMAQYIQEEVGGDLVSVQTAELCPDATLLEGLAVSGLQVEESKSDIQSWAAGLDL